MFDKADSQKLVDIFTDPVVSRPTADRGVWSCPGPVPAGDRAFFE